MRTYLVAIALVTGLSAAESRGQDVLDEVLAAYEAHYAQIETIRLQLTTMTEPIISKEELMREFRVLPPFPRKTELVSHRDGRLYLRDDNPWNGLSGVDKRMAEKYPDFRENGSDLCSLPYEEVRAAAEAELQRLENRNGAFSHIRVYDGTRFWKYDPGVRLKRARDVPRRGFSIVKPERFYLSRTILELMLFAFEIPGIPNEERREKSRLPELFQHADVQVSDRSETIDGAACIVVEAPRIIVEAPGRERLFLDPELGFAVRKRQWLRDGRPVYEFAASGFERVADGLFFPRRAVCTQYGIQGMGHDRYIGRPIDRDVVRVDRIELNDPAHLAYFTVDVPAGSFIADATLTPLDAEGNPVPFPESEPNIVPSVSYIKPVDPAELKPVIRDAQQRVGRRSVELRDRPNRSVTVAVLIGIHVALLLLLVAVLGYRRWAARRKS